MESNETIRTFGEITGCSSVSESREFLEKHAWQLQNAVTAYFARDNSNNGQQSVRKVRALSSKLPKM
jgi:hypothetical protein